MKKTHSTTSTVAIALAALLPLAGCSSKVDDTQLGTRTESIAGGSRVSTGTTTGGATTAGTSTTTGGTTTAGATATTGGATTTAGTTATTGGTTTTAGTTATTGGTTTAGTTATTGGTTTTGATATTGGTTTTGATATTGGTTTAGTSTTTGGTTTTGAATGAGTLPRSLVDYSNVRLVFRDSLDPYGRYKAGGSASAVPKCLGANGTIEACDFKNNPSVGSRWNLQQVDTGGAQSGYAIRQVISKSSGLCLEYAPLQIIPTAIPNPTYKKGTVSMKACNPLEPRQHFLFSGRGELLTAGPDAGFCVNMGRGLDVWSLKPGDLVGVFMCKTGDASLYDPVP